MSAPHPVPLLYRILFTYVDPLFCLLGAYTHLFDPLTTLTGYSASFAQPAPTEAIHLLDSMAGFFLLLGIVEGFLLRARGRDVVVWRTVMAGGAVLDACMTLGAVRALQADGRTDMQGWRGDDYRLVVGNAVFGVIRLACTLGVGMGKGEKGKSA